MPEGKKRARTLRRVFVKTPGGRTTLHYKERKPGKAHCADCGKVLAGVIQGTVSKVKGLPKSKRNPKRPYAGMLCGGCMRVEMVRRARG